MLFKKVLIVTGVILSIASISYYSLEFKKKNSFVTRHSNVYRNNIV